MLQKPELLPDGSELLVAVSGGQDSMALLALLRDLRQLHGWSLRLWHGDHGWHQGSSQVAEDLTRWCFDQGFELQTSRAAPNEAGSEASARDWRYHQLLASARQNHCDVVTAHTATDRAETVLLNIARGCNLQGLSALPAQRPLCDQDPDGPQLRRPLMHWTRTETAQICRDLKLPIWHDPSNFNLALARNRIRHTVLPVLDELHPGSDRRIAQLSEGVAQVRNCQLQLSHLALQAIQRLDGLDRQRLAELDEATGRILLVAWLRKVGGPQISSKTLENLTHQLCRGKASGQFNLSDGWTLSWNPTTIRLAPMK